MNQHYRPDPILFIRIQLENAWDAGDLEGALRMSHLMDEAMLNRYTYRGSGPAKPSHLISAVPHKIKLPYKAASFFTDLPSDISILSLFIGHTTAEAPAHQLHAAPAPPFICCLWRAPGQTQGHADKQ